MTMKVENPWNYYDFRPLTESVADEFWAQHLQRVMWVGSVDRASVNPNGYLPSYYDGWVDAAAEVYERIIAVDMVVIPVACNPQLPVGGAVYVPLVGVRAAVGSWVGAVSWLALESVGEIVREFGRPPWHEPVEIQSVWGRGFGRAQCVAFRPGLRSHVRRSK